MMNFRKIRKNLVDILGQASKNAFLVVGYQRQSINVENVSGLDRTVQIYNSAGNFPKSGGSSGGYATHNINYQIELTVAATATGDLSILNDPNAGDREVKFAIESFKDASEIADNAFDKLLEIVWQILMDAKNVDVGFDKGVVANRWIEDWHKDVPNPVGEQVILTGYLILSIGTTEEVVGEAGVAGQIQNIIIDIDGDDVEQAAVTVND